MVIAAKGVYHKYNVLKYRVLNILYHDYIRHGIPLNEIPESEWLDTPTIAEILGTQSGAISNDLDKYRVCGYVRRDVTNKIKGKPGRRRYGWRITNCGIKVYLALRDKMEKGQSLNFHSNEKVDSYIGLTRRGYHELGRTEEYAKQIESQFIPQK